MKVNDPAHETARPDDAGAATLHHVFVDVESTSHPTPGPARHSYVCQADVTVIDGNDEARYQTSLTIHHPRGWMGVEAGFAYSLDEGDYPTFEERARAARDRAIAACASDKLISVMLLGTGKPDFPTE